MPFIVVTAAVFHEPMLWLNADAPLNMLYIVVVEPVFHEPMYELNETASRNIIRMVVTLLVFHEPMSSVKFRFFGLQSGKYVSQ